MYDKIKYWYNIGLWSAEKLQNAVDKGIITPEQAEEILNESV